MSVRRFKPRRRLRSELLPLVSVGCVLFAVIVLFPREQRLVAWPSRLGARAASPATADCAFVTLNQEQEDRALAAARMSWQSDATQAARPHVEMLPSSLPETAFSPAVTLASRPPADICFRARPHVRVLPPTAAAAPPVRLPREDVPSAQKAFPRELMLRLQ